MGRTQHVLLCAFYMCIAALLPSLAFAEDRPADKPNTVFLPLTLQARDGPTASVSPAPPTPTDPGAPTDPTPVPPTPTDPTPAPAPSPVELTTLEAEVVRLTNEYRTQNSTCQPLTVSPELTIAARAHSQDMADNDFVSPIGSDGSQPWDRIKAAGYPWMNAGENIAAGSNIAKDVVDQWINDPKANIFNCEYKEIGIGFAYDPDDTFDDPRWPYYYYWTQDFGTRP